MGLTTDEENRAKQIVEQWFWQMAEGHNYRFAHATKSMTLFYESAPLEADALKLVIEYLQTRTGLTELVVNHKRLAFDAAWSTKDAWYQTAPGENWAGTESSKVRLYWVLVQAAAGTGDGPYTVEDGCKYKVEHTFFWDVAEAPAAGDVTSSSGVQKSIQGLTHDRESGLYSYVIETRTTVEQDIELYDTSVTAFETVQEAQYLGVKASDVAGKGLAAGASGGVLVERRISKNPDCTSDVLNRKTTEQNVKGAVKTWRKTLRGTVETTTDRSEATSLNGTNLAVGETRRSEKTPGGLWNNTVETTTTDAAGEIASESEKTIFEHRDATTENVATEPTAEQKEAAAAADGTIEQVSVRKTEEGTFDVTTQTTEEQNVKGAVKTWRKTLRGTVETTTDRSEATSLNGTNLAVGETRRSEKTPGGLWNNTVETTTTDAAGEIASESEKTIFEHRDATTENVATEPTAEQKEAAAAADGTIEQVSVRKTEEGTFDVTTQTTEEQKVEDARKVTRKTLRGTVTTTTHRNLTGTELATKTASNIAVGETRTTEKTPGGLTDLTIEKPDATAQDKKTLSFSCERTSAVHTDITVETMLASDQDAAIVDTGENPTTKVQPNHVKRVTVRHNEDGLTVDKETVETEYEETDEAESVSKYGGVETVTTKRKLHAEEKVEIEQEDLDNNGKVPPNKVIEIDNQPNDHHSFTTMKRVTEYEEVDSRTTTGNAVKDIEYSDDEYNYAQRSFANQPELAPILPNDQEIAGGRLSLTFHPNGHGSWDGSYVLRKARTDYGSGDSGKVIIDEGKNVQYSKTRRYGTWSYVVLNETFTFYWVWELRRVCSFRFRVIGLSSGAADSLASSLTSSYTRNIEDSVWNDSGVLAGNFSDRSGGSACMTKAFKYHIEGDVYGVCVVVNEQSVKLRGQNQSTASAFSTENNWSYPTSGSAS